MTCTHSQVITITGKRQSGVTTTLLEHVKKCVDANPGKTALVITYDLAMTEEMDKMVLNMFPSIRDKIIVAGRMSLDQIRKVLETPPEGGYCGVFADDGYHYLSHQGLMKLAREYPLLDIVVGDSDDSDIKAKLMTESGVDTDTDAPKTQLRGSNSALLMMDDAPYAAPTDSSEMEGMERNDNDSIYGADAGFKAFCADLKKDFEYAWGWQCALAILIRDGGKGVSHRDANFAAAEFMNNVFGVNVIGSEAWRQFEDEWEARSTATHYVLSQAGELSLVCTNGIIRDLGLTTDEFKMFALEYLMKTDADIGSTEDSADIPLSVFPVLMFKWEEQYGNESIYQQ